MKKILLLALLAGLLPVRAQDEDVITMDDVIQTAQDFARDNLDPEVVRNLPELDQQKVREFLALMQKELRGEYVVDLAPLKDAAQIILPLLESRAETQPYAAWLKARLDYLEAAEEWRRLTPPPKTKPGEPLLPVPNPRPRQAPAPLRSGPGTATGSPPWPPAACRCG